MALASHSPRYSRLVSFDRSGAATELRVPGIAINSIERLGRNRYFVGKPGRGFTAGSGLKAILTSPIGGGQLLWEPTAQTLWVESGDAWSSFPLAATIAHSDLKPTGIVKVSPGARYLLAFSEGPKSNVALIKTPVAS